MATWKKWTSAVLVNGQPEPNVKVYVYEPGTTEEIPVYEDEGVTAITQPILTDSHGRYAFFVDVDAYPEIRLYLEKEGVDFSETNEDLDGVPVPGASAGEAGASTFLELTDTPSNYVGRGGEIVLVKTTEDGIETKPWPVTGTVLNFFLSDDDADIGNYYYMYSMESGSAYSSLTSSSLSIGNDQLLWSFVTKAGEPGKDQLALGVYTAALFLKKSGNKNVRIYWKLFKRDGEGTEAEILQSAVSDYLTTDNSQYLISAYLNEDQALDPTDRLVLKLYANVSGTGTDVTVTLTMEGDYDSRLAIHVLSSAFSLDRLSDVTLSSPSDKEMLAYDAASEKWTNQTPGEAGVLASDGSVPLTGDWDTGGFRISNLKSLNFKDATTLTISSGAITVSQSYHYVDTEGGAASDDLDTINGGTAGDVLYLRSADSSRIVVIKHGAGNIVTPDGTDYSLDSTDKVVALLFDGTNWHLIGAAGGGGGGATQLNDLTDVTITSPADNEFLAYDSGSGKWVNQTPGEAGVLAADGSVPLTGDLDFNFYSALNLKSVMGVVDVTTFPGSDLGAKINAAYAAGYKVLYIPPGNYTIAEGNEVVFSDDNGIVLQGAGKYATIITYEGSGTALTFSKTKFNTISGFMLKGNDLGSNGIKFDGMWMSHVSDIWVRSFTNKGIELTTPDTFGSYWNEFEQVFVDNCLYNLYLDSVEGGAGINANVFLGCKITDAKSGASATNIYLGSTGGGANENVFILPDVSAASGIGIDNNGHSNIFIHPYVENCGSIGFRNNGQYTIIIGASFEGNAQNSDWIISPTVFLYKYDTVIRPDMIATSAGPIKAVKSCPYGSGIGDIFYFGIANETAVDNGKPYQFKIRLDGNNYGHDAILTKIKRGGATEDVLKLSRAGRIEMLQPLKLGTSAPSTPVEGDMYWDATNHVLKVYDGTEWKTLAWAT